MTAPQTVLITGASSGIGKATASLFAERGWNVAATMRSPEDSSIAETDTTTSLPLDVTDVSSINAAVDATVARFGTIDALINNAGYGLAGPLEATPDDSIRRQIDTNLLGVIHTTKAVLPHMRAAKTGVIVNVTSVGGIITLPLFSLYHATKWGVEGLSESLSYELRGLGVRIKIVEPGGVRTDFSGRSLDLVVSDAPEEYHAATTRALATFSDPERQASYSEPEDTAQVILAAAEDTSDRLRFIAGKDAEAMIDLRGRMGDEAAIQATAKRFGMI